MRIRTGRKNPNTLYLQVGDRPSDEDLRIGFMIHPVEAALLAEADFSGLHLDELRVHAATRIEAGG